MKNRIAEERLKWEEEERTKQLQEREANNATQEDEARRERWELMERMQQMEKEMDEQIVSKRLRNASARSDKLHPKAPPGHPDAHRRGSSHHHAVALSQSVPAPKIPDA